MSTDPFSQTPLGKFETVTTSFPAFLGLTDCSRIFVQGYLSGFFLFSGPMQAPTDTVLEPVSHIITRFVVGEHDIVDAAHMSGKGVYFC